MSLELKLTFSLDRSGKPEETVVKYRLPPDATGGGKSPTSSVKPTVL